MAADEKRLVITGGFTGSFWVIVLGCRLGFPDVIVPFGWALALIVLGIAGLAATTGFAIKALVFKRDVSDRHTEILRQMAESLGGLQNLALDRSAWRHGGEAEVLRNSWGRFTAFSESALNLADQIPYDPSTMQTVRDFVQIARMAAHDAMNGHDDREARRDLAAIAPALFRCLHASKSVNRWRIDLPDWCFTDAEKKTLRYRWRQFWKRWWRRENKVRENANPANRPPDMASEGAQYAGASGPRKRPSTRGEANLRAAAQAVMEEAEEEHERAAERLSALLSPGRRSQLVDKANRRALIASGRDLVHAYRGAGLAEPFGAFAVKQRSYLDIQPHLGNEYLQEAIRRAEVNDTPVRRDYAAAMFLRELARLEKEWDL